MRNLMTNFRFVILWSLGSVVAIIMALIAGFLILSLGGMTLTAIFGEEAALQPVAILWIFLIVLFSSIGLSAGLIIGWIQKSVLRMRTREPWRGWLIASAIGGAIGFNAVVFILAFQGYGYVMWMVMPSIETLLWFGFQGLVIFYGSLGICQAFALSHYVRGSWTWVMANIVAAIVLFSLLSVGIISSVATPLFSILLLLAVCGTPGIVTGFSMVWLMENNWKQGY